MKCPLLAFYGTRAGGQAELEVVDSTVKRLSQEPAASTSALISGETQVARFIAAWAAKL